MLSDASAIGSKGKLSGKFSKIVNVIPMLSLLVGTITSYRKQSSFVFDTFFELCRKFNIQYSIATTQEKAFIDEVTESIYERKKAERDGKVPTYQQRV